MAATIINCGCFGHCCGRQTVVAVEDGDGDRKDGLLETGSAAGETPVPTDGGRYSGDGAAASVAAAAAAAAAGGRAGRDARGGPQRLVVIALFGTLDSMAVFAALILGGHVSLAALIVGVR